MAVTPEIQSLIDILHEDVRDDAWITRLFEAHATAVEGIPTANGVEQMDILREVLRQHVDDRIMTDIMRASAAADTEGFVATLTEPYTDPVTNEASIPSQNWGTIRPFTNDDVEEEGLRNVLGDNSAPDLTERQLQAASRDGDFAVMVQLLGAMRPPEPNTPEPVRDADGNVTGHASPQGEALQEYLEGIVYEANQGHGNRPYNPATGYLDFDPGPDDPENPTGNGYLNVLEPEEMVNALRTQIFQDIQNGDFPLGDIDPDDAAETADRMADILAANVFNNDRSMFIEGRTPEGRITYHYRNPDGQMEAAIDQMFAGENAIFNNTMDMGWNAAQFEEQFYDLMVRHGFGITEDHAIEHFTKLVEGFENEETGETIAAVIEIPEEMRAQFYDQVRAGFEHATNVGLNDASASAFGEYMAERFEIIDTEHTQAPQNSEALDYGERIRVMLGDETENGFNVVNSEGTVLFEISAEHIALYASNGTGEEFSFDEIRGVDGHDQLREVFGDNFFISPVSPLDAGLSNDDGTLMGYYIASPDTDNYFHVGFDAIPETGVSAEFQEIRGASMDSRDEAPDVATPDVVVSREASVPPAIPDQPGAF